MMPTRFSAGLAAGGRELLPPCVEQRHRTLGQHVDAVADGPADARPARHRHPQRRAAWLHGVGRDPHVVELVALAGVAEALPRPGQLQDVDALLGARHAVRHREAERLELVDRVAEADAELDAPARQLVEDGEVLGEAQRVRERDDRDVRRDPHPLRAGRGRTGDRGERRQVAVLDEVVLAEPDLVEPELVEPGDLVDRLGVDVLQRVVAPRWAAEVVGDAEADWWGHGRTLRVQAAREPRRNVSCGGPGSRGPRGRRGRRPAGRGRAHRGCSSSPRWCRPRSSWPGCAGTPSGWSRTRWRPRAGPSRRSRTAGRRRPSR